MSELESHAGTRKIVIAQSEAELASRLKAYRFSIQGDRTTWQALHYLNLYRLFLTILYLSLFFTPIMAESLPRDALRVCRGMTLLLVFSAPILLILGQYVRRRPGSQSVIGLAIDLCAILVIMHAMGGVTSGMGTPLVGCTLLAAVIFPIRLALLYAAAASIAVLWQSAAAVLGSEASPADIAPSGVLGAALFATTMLGQYLANRVRESQEFARQRGLDLANLAEVNEMIIARMRTGIALIDPYRVIHLMNEAAWFMAGMPDKRSGKIDEVAPEIEADFDYWEEHGQHLNRERQLADGVPAIIPRFAALGSGAASDALVFMEDTSMVSRRAQEITLASLGQLSASIAHEIRNPLSAIKHSAQLLCESDVLSDPDRRLSSIIFRHCNRLDDIVENVLSLARRSPPAPEPVDLSDFAKAFVDEFLRFQETYGATIQTKAAEKSTLVEVDVSQLQQILWNLCHNAVKYGRSLDQPAQITVRAGESELAGPWIQVEDFGPGITVSDQAHLFEPFFRASEGGTGLGLYLCRQLAEANQAKLTFAPNEPSGSIFRVSLPRAR